MRRECEYALLVVLCLVPLVHGQEEPIDLDAIWKLERLEPAKAASLRESLAARARDPEVARFLGAAMRHPLADLRSLAVSVSAAIADPWLASVRRDALRAERNPRARSAHLAALVGSRVRPGRPELAALLDARATSDEAAAFDAALYGFARRRVQPLMWTGAAAPDEDGFAAVSSSDFELEAPRIQGPARLLLAYRLSGEARVAAVVRCGQIDLGTLLLEPGVGPLATNGGVRTIAMSVPDGVRIAAKLRVSLADGEHGALRVHGVAALPPETADAAGSELVLAAEIDNPAFSRLDGFMPGRERGGGLTAGGKSAQITFELEGDVSGYRHLYVEHWCPDASTWRITLNDMPLVNLLSRPHPRPARPAGRLVGLRSGRNVLRIDRIGKTDHSLHVLAVRLFR